MSKLKNSNATFWVIFKHCKHKGVYFGSKQGKLLFAHMYFWFSLKFRMSILKCNQTVNEAITHVDSCMRDIDLFLCFLNEVFFLSNCSHLSQLWFYADWHASIFCWHRVISVNCQPHPALAKIASKRSDVCLNNLVKTQVQITSLQKLASSRYNR